MSRRLLAGQNRASLRRWLLLFLLALLAPTLILIRQAYRELKWEAFHQQRLQAEALAARIDDQLTVLIRGEEARAFTDYSFLNIAGDPAANFLQRSPLSNYPVTSAIPGIVGYFQVDARGALSSPLLPAASVGPRYGVSADELAARGQVFEHMAQILSANRLVSRDEDRAELESAAPSIESDSVDRSGAGGDDEAGRGAEVPGRLSFGASEAPAPTPYAAQQGFDQLAEKVTRPSAARQSPTSPPLRDRRQAVVGLERADALKLRDPYGQSKRSPAAAKASQPASRARKEINVLPEAAMRAQLDQGPADLDASVAEEERLAKKKESVRITTFESEIDPAQFSLLDSGHFVLFRTVWLDGERVIQGALIEQDPFLEELVGRAFVGAALARHSHLIVAWQERVLQHFSARPGRHYFSAESGMNGALLLQTHPTGPMSELELIFTVERLGIGPGGRVIAWASALLIGLLCGGFFWLYRLALRQLELVRQQQDFVAAVSHELKTPLTSIRMYSEMLREGWATEQKRQVYYDYIHTESERLSRLITNVLQLARMTRNELRVDLREMSAGQLMGQVRSAVLSQIDGAGFAVNWSVEPDAEPVCVQVDPDFMINIMINLVDNALKFAAGSAHKVIDIGCRLRDPRTLEIQVRDYGPGIPANQLKKIFELFYRAENESTRETVGTGIGLALVRQMASVMNGTISASNAAPGAMFRVALPVVADSLCP